MHSNTDTSLQRVHIEFIANADSQQQSSAFSQCLFTCLACLCCKMTLFFVIKKQHHKASTY